MVMSAPNFYSQEDQDIYKNKNSQFLGESRFRGTVAPNPEEIEEVTETFGIPATTVFQNNGGGGRGEYNYDQTWTKEGDRPNVLSKTDFNINPAAQLTGKGRIDPMGSTYDNLAMMGPMDYKLAGYHRSEIPGQEGYETPSKYFEEPSLMNKGITGIKDFFSKFNKPRYRGELGDRLSGQYQTGQKLPFFLSKIAGMQSPFNTESKNYNANFADQLNYLEGLDNYIGRDTNSGHLKYGPESVLRGQNVISGFGSNDYEKQLKKKIEWFKKREEDGKGFNEDRKDQAKAELLAWQNQNNGTTGEGGYTPSAINVQKAKIGMPEHLTLGGGSSKGENRGSFTGQHPDTPKGGSPGEQSGRWHPGVKDGGRIGYFFGGLAARGMKR